MKRIFAFILALMLVLASSASAERATLVYSFGEDALNKVLLDQENTVSYKGNTYVFDFGGFAFEGAFNMLGGNTRTVFECEVPKIRMESLLSETGDVYLGTVRIAPPRNMNLFVFSGDRRDAGYTLVDSVNANDYVLDVYATRDETGTLRLVDMVFLYSYESGGAQKYYAASVYISYEGYYAAPADVRPSVKLIEEEKATEEKLNEYAEALMKMEAENAAVLETLAALEEELSKSVDSNLEKDALIESLRASAALAEDLANENQALSEKIEGLEGEIIQLENNRNDEMLVELTKQVMQLEMDNARMSGEAEALKKASEAKDKELEHAVNENEMLLMEIETLTKENEAFFKEKNDIAGELESVKTELDALKKEAEEILNAQKESLRTIDDLALKNADLESEKNALLEKVTGLEKEIGILKAEAENAKKMALNYRQEEKIDLENLTNDEVAFYMYSGTMQALKSLTVYMDEIDELLKEEKSGITLLDADEEWFSAYIGKDPEKKEKAEKMQDLLKAFSENATAYTAFDYAASDALASGTLTDAGIRYLSLIGHVDTLDEIGIVLDQAALFSGQLEKVDACYRYRANVAKCLNSLIAVHEYLVSGEKEAFEDVLNGFKKDNSAFLSDFEFIMRSMFKDFADESAGEQETIVPKALEEFAKALG